MLHSVVGDAVSPAVRRVGLHPIDAGGKRLRPLLLLLAGEAAGGDANTMADLAAAVALLHVASLHHDDIMDEAPLRRGLPSANALWRSRVTAMAGGYLVTRAMELLAPRGTAFLAVANDAVGRRGGRGVELTAPPPQPLTGSIRLRLRLHGAQASEEAVAPGTPGR